MSSRLFGVDTAANLGSLSWTYAVNGTVVGTPQISADGNFVAIAYNTEILGLFTVEETGFILILDREGNRVVQTPGEPFTTFGPVSLGQQDGKTTAFWGESSHGGYGPSGRIFRMELQSPYAVVAEHFLDSTITIPVTVAPDGSGMWTGGKEASIHYWSLQPSQQGRRWKKQLPMSRRNVTYRK